VSPLEQLDRDFDRVLADPKRTTPAINAAGMALIEASKRYGPTCHAQVVNSVAARWVLLRKTLARQS
jgi:hypothetical protein